MQGREKGVKVRVGGGCRTVIQVVNNPSRDVRDVCLGFMVSQV